MTIKECRKTKLFTQQQLAKELKVSQSTVSYWEQGETIPDKNTMQKLADVLKVDIKVVLSCFYGEPKEEII